MMKYKLLSKKHGLNPIHIADFETPEQIVDFVKVDNAYYLLSNHHLFVFEGNLLRQYGGFEFSHATSIESHKGLKTLLIAENGGRNVLSLPKEDGIPVNYYCGNEIDYLTKELSKHGNELTAKIKADVKGNIYTLIKECNVIFFKSYTFSTIRPLVGNRFAGYSQSFSAANCSINFPESISLADKKLFIADTGNHVVRVYNGGPLETILGRPTSKTITPKQIVATKDMLYFLSNNVYTTNMSKPHFGDRSVYTPTGEMLMCRSDLDDNGIYILESYGS